MVHDFCRHGQGKAPFWAWTLVQHSMGLAFAAITPRINLHTARELT